MAARDAEVKALTEKLKAFAAETRKLMDQVRKLFFFFRCHLLLKCIILPRQARDKRRGNSDRSCVFLQLAAETAKSAELAAHYSTLQGDMDAAEGKLDEMAQLNRSLVRIYTIYSILYSIYSVGSISNRVYNSDRLAGWLADWQQGLCFAPQYDYI